MQQSSSDTFDKKENHNNKNTSVFKHEIPKGRRTVVFSKQEPHGRTEPV